VLDFVLMMNSMEFVCGHSHSLNKVSRVEDRNILKRMLEDD
jgi:hypothetical protein